MPISHRRFLHLALTAALWAVLPGSAQAQVSTGAFAAGGFDMFWYSVMGQVGNPTGGDAAWVIDPAVQHPNWITPPADSRWITRTRGWEVDAPDNIWTTYFTQFTVADAGAFALSGNWSSDNDSYMWLNGTQMGSVGFTAFTSLTPFTLNSGFVSGTNTLAFQVFNGSASGNPSGLLVSDLQANAVPEPASLLLLATGLLGLGVAARRRRGATSDD